MTEEAKKAWLEFEGVVVTGGGTYYRGSPANRAYKTPEILVDQVKKAIETQMNLRLMKEPFTDGDKEFIRGLKCALDIITDIKPPKE